MLLPFVQQVEDLLQYVSLSSQAIYKHFKEDTGALIHWGKEVLLNSQFTINVFVFFIFFYFLIFFCESLC